MRSLHMFLKILHNKTGGYRLISWVITVLSFFVGAVARAIDTGIDATASVAGLKPANTLTLPQVIGNILGYVLSLLGVVALAFIIAGGYMWMTAGGNDEQIKKAKSLLTNSIIGLVIIVTAYVVVNFVVTSIISSVGVT